MFRRLSPLAYSIDKSCEIDGLCRSSKYNAINPDPAKRRGLPYLPSFTVGKRRLILAADHKAWLETLKAASTNAAYRAGL
jgi:hypothetical protein